MRSSAWFTAALLLSSLASAEEMSIAIPSLEMPSPRVPIDVSASMHTLYLNQRDLANPEADPSNRLLHEMVLRTQRGPYSLRLQTGSRLAIGPQPAIGGTTDRSLVLEKKLLEADWDGVNLKLGDSYQELGRGIALSLFKDDVFGINNTLEGIALRVQPAGWDFGAFGGRINTLVLPVALNPLGNPLPKSDVWLAGGSFKAPLSSSVKLGAHAVLAYNQPYGDTRMNQSWNAMGASLEAESIADAVDFYGETNYLYDQFRAGEVVKTLPAGWGSYTALSYSPTAWKVKIEGKDYRNFSFAFRKPPSLEEDVVEVTNLSDVSASRLQVERRWNELKASATGSTLMGYDRELSAPFYHGVLGGKFQLASRWETEVKTGYRFTRERNDLLHVSWKNKFRIQGSESVEVGIRKQLAHKKLDIIPIEDDRNILDFTYNFSEKWSGSLGYEFVPSNDPETGNHFFNIGAAAKLGALTGRAFIGQTSGGTLCSGGICRQVPAFTGATVETSYVF